MGGSCTEQGPQGVGGRVSARCRLNPGLRGALFSRELGGLEREACTGGGRPARVPHSTRRGRCCWGAAGTDTHPCHCPKQLWVDPGPGPQERMSAVCLSVCVSSSSSASAPGERQHRVPTHHLSAGQVLTFSRNGSVRLLDVAVSQTVCAFAPPRPYRLAAPWEPTFVVSLHHPYFLLRGMRMHPGVAADHFPDFLRPSPCAG